MTICIGVLCDNRRKAIALSDRMLTSFDQTLAFEHDEPKIVKLFDNCIAVTSGAATLHQPIFQAVCSEMRETKPRISDIAEKIKIRYQESRQRFMNDFIFSRRGLTLERFYEDQTSLDESTILELNSEMDEFDLQLDIVVLGVDEGSRAHIYSINNPGFTIPHDPLGFCSIGTGIRHADPVFAYRRFTPSFPLKRAIYVAYEAKKRAELAGGVGPTTDIAIVSDNKTETRFLPQKTIDQLDSIHQEMESKAQYREEIDEALKSFRI